MKPLYKLSRQLNSNSHFSANTIYITLRTLAVCIPSLILGLLCGNLIHIPNTTPEIVTILFCGWITLIFGFWGALLYLLRKD